MRGATLIELLIGMLLAGIAIAGSLSGLAQGQRAWRDADLRGRLHERLQYVFATLEPELQMAGFFGRSVPAAFEEPAQSQALATPCGPGAVLPLTPVQVITDAGWPWLCAAQGGGRLPGTALLLIRRAATRAAVPGDGSLSLADDFDPPARRELRVRLYYVARQSDGDALTPSLRVKSLTAVAGVPAFVDTEVMSGVEDLQVHLLSSAGAATRAQVRVRMRADAPDVPLHAAVPAVEVSRRFTLRNAPAH